MGKNSEFDFSTCLDKNLKGTRTEQNLKEAFSGESQARNRYTYFAKQARKEGFNIIADIFDSTAENEMQHGKIWFRLLNGGDIPKTLENLNSAASAEQYEWEDMYARFAQDARDEGFDKIANLFEKVREIEKMHMARYEKLAKLVKNNTVYKREKPVLWECSKCGYRFELTSPPEHCPYCKHPQEYFFEVCE